MQSGQMMGEEIQDTKKPMAASEEQEQRQGTLHAPYTEQPRIRNQLAPPPPLALSVSEQAKKTLLVSPTPPPTLSPPIKYLEPKILDIKSILDL